MLIKGAGAAKLGGSQPRKVHPDSLSEMDLQASGAMHQRCKLRFWVSFGVSHLTL